MANAINKIRRYKKLTPTYLPANTTEIRDIIKKEYAMDYINKAIDIKNKTTKTKYCRDKKISIHTLNKGLEMLQIKCDKKNTKPNKNQKYEKGQKTHRRNKDKEQITAGTKHITAQNDTTEENTDKQQQITTNNIDWSKRPRDKI